MKIYRSLNRIEAITFDLDDTLYDNRPVIANTEQQVMSFIHRRYPNLTHMTVEDFNQSRANLRQKEPDIYHDVSQWRWRSLAGLLTGHGYSLAEAEKGATEAMDHFHHWRSQITVTDDVHQTLQALGQRFRLAVITNGNARPDAFGIDSYFEFILRSGPDGRAKPYDDMYQEAAARFNIPLARMLHVGDHLVTDVAGSLLAGAQSCWVNNLERDLMTDADARILPHIEISRLASLEALL